MARNSSKYGARTVTRGSPTPATSSPRSVTNRIAGAPSACGRRRTSPSRAASPRCRAHRAARSRGADRARAWPRRTAPGPSISRRARREQLLEAAGRSRSQSASSSAIGTSRRRSTWAPVHSSLAMPSRRSFTMSSLTPTRCASTSRTRHSGVAGAGRSSVGGVDVARRARRRGCAARRRPRRAAQSSGAPFSRSDRALENTREHQRPDCPDEQHLGRVRLGERARDQDARAAPCRRRP